MGEDTTGMSSSVSKIREEFMALSGVDIMADEDTFKGTADIILEVADAWKDMTDIQRASLAELAAGKRGAQAFVAAVENPDIIRETIQTAQTDALGSMDRQLEVYNQSIQASLDRFHVAFEQLATDFISSGFVKGVVDAGTEIIKIIDAIVKNIGVLGTALTALGIAKIFGTINAGVKTVDTLAVALGKLPQTATGIEKLGVIFTNLGLKATGASTALGGLGSSLLAFLSNPVTLGVGAAVATVAGIALAIKKQQDDLNKQATNTTNSWKSSQSEIDNYKDKYTELNEKLNDANLSESERIGIKRQLLDLQNEIVTKYGDQVSGIDLVNGKLETQLGILSKITAETAKQNLRDNYDAYQQSVKEMEKSRKYTVSNGNITGGMYKQFASEEMQNQIASVFTGANFTKKGDGFKFTGDATEFNSAVNQVLDGLEALKDGASETDKAILQNAINSAQEALLKNKEVLDKYQENYQAYLQQSLFAEGFGDELSEYARRTQEYNDALLSGNMEKIVEAKSQLDEYQSTVDGILGEHHEYGDFFNEIADSVDTTTEAVMNFKDIIDDGVAESTNGLKDYADVIRDTVNRVKKMELDPVDVEQILLNGGEGFDLLSQLAKLFNKDFDFTNRDQVRGFADILAQLGVVADETAQEVDLSSASFTDFMHYASDSIDTIDKVNSALVNAFASGGLSAGIDKETGALTGDVAEIIKAYSGLEGFDVANIFERTAKGVIVNRDALRELQKQQEDTLKDEFATRMTEAWNEWKKAVETGDVDDASYWKSQYENVNLLASAYDGATSAYQRWLDAQKMGEAGDMYDTVAKTALKRGKELYDSGLVGTNEFRAIAQLYSDIDLSTASVEELTAAYESGYATVKKYFTEGQEGAVAFADKIVDLGYATKDAEGNYDFFNGIDTEAIAHDLGISVDLVEAAFNKLGDYGFDIHFNFDDGQSAIMQFKQRLDELNSEEVSPDVFVDDAQLREIAEYLLNLDDEEIDTEFNITNEDTVDSLIDKLSKKYNVQATVSADNSEVPSTMSTVIDAAVEINQHDIKLADQTVHVEPEPNPLEVDAVAKLNSTEVDEYKPKDHDPTVTYHKKSEEVDNYDPPNYNRNVNYWVSVSGTGALDAIPADGTTRDVYVNVHTNQMYTGTVSRSAFQGMGASHIRGTAHASGILGKVGLKSDENALINELGPEIVVRPSDDSWMIFNDGKPTFASLKKDDVIFNAEMSEELLRTGKADDYARFLGSSYINGTVKGSAHATVRGGGKFKKATNTTKKKNSGGGNNGGGGGGNGSSSTKEAKEFEEVLDEIEIKIDRVERSINNLDTIASNTFNGTTERITALNRELKKTSHEIDIQKVAYKRYMLEANKYAEGLDPKLLEEVKNGKVDIKTIKDEDVWKKIENFRKYYEAALSARDAVYKLQAQEADLWTQRFNIAQTAYDNKIAQYQHMIDMMDSYISEAESKGRITANKYREKQITEERKKLQDLNKEQTNLMKKMTDALKNGMAVGSEAYYEMLNGINSVSEAIVESNANIAELQKSIRETDWEIFDRASDAIANMRDELEFIYGLLGEDLYDKKGNVTDNGIAGFGILASQYNFAMVESQRYAEEIKKINAEIAKDPLNQDLIDRRQDLYESQRDAIKQANDYKESIRDLVKEGIELQIDSMKELIQNYEDLLDAQKDEMDYSKRVSDQQANINKLQKQLNAYANDDSEEGAARRQKLRNELKTAQENLQQTQEERRISQTKKMLSDLQEDYENVLNARLDDLDALVKAVTDGVNKNSAKISEAINVATANVGYTVTHEMQTMLSGGKDLVSYFLGGRFINELTKAIAVANNIQNGVAKTVTKTENEQSKTVRQTEAKQKNTQTEMVKAQNYKNKITGTDGKWLQDSNKQRIGWQFNDGTKATGWSKIDNDWYYFNDEGKIRAGLQKIGNYNYFLKRYGGRAESEWVKVGTKWYYFDKDGHALTGWHELEKDGTKGWRYFNPNTAAMATNAWVKNSSKDGVYYVNGSGIMVKNGKYETKDGWRTFDKNGKWKGYRLGTKSVGSDGLYWTNESAPETIIRKSDGAVLTKLNAGDTVFNSDATNTMWDFANDPMKFLRSLGYTGGTLSAGNDVDLVINLSGLRSPSEFMDALRRDKKFERFIQEITIGRVSGHGVLAKNAIAF